MEFYVYALNLKCRANDNKMEYNVDWQIYFIYLQ